MKRKARIVIVVIVLLISGLWGVRLYWQARLPHFKLVGGGEFRVFKICYGTHDDDVHHLGGAPKQLVWAWDNLPVQLQRFIPAPDHGAGALSPGTNRHALSIYWAWVDPLTRKAETGPSGDVLMITDSGEQTNLGWPEPFDDRTGGGYRQIFVDEPPRNSTKLRFRVPVEDETVEFTIDNPAYNQ